MVFEQEKRDIRVRNAMFRVIELSCLFWENLGATWRLESPVFRVIRTYN